MAIMYNCGYFITYKHYSGHQTVGKSLTSNIQAGGGTAEEEQEESDLQAHSS